MPNEKEPLRKVPRGFVPPGYVPYKVKDGDSWASLAKRHGVTEADLIDANFKTRDPAEVNWYLHTYVGCTLPTVDRNNWRFSASASPGVVHVPADKSALFYVVPGMELIAQDKTMSCWFASGQMLINWRQKSRRACEIAHPDPALVAKWSKLYDDNPGISNDQIQAFATDLGLSAVGRMTPTPERVRDLLQTHGPLWVNGKSHITVIAGIRRTTPATVEVLVFDPGKPELPQGAWHDFFKHYGLTPHTSLDASTGAPTSMLHLD